MIIFAPHIINSFIKLIYASDDEFNDLHINPIKKYANFVQVPYYNRYYCEDNEILIIPKITKKNICLLEYSSNGWIIYHALPDIEKYTTNIKYNDLSTECRHLAIITPDNLEIIQSINSEGYCHNYLLGIAKHYNPIKNIYYDKYFVTNEKYICENIKPVKNFNDIVAFSETKGIIYLNSTDCFDLINCLLFTPSDSDLSYLVAVLVSESYRNVTCLAFQDFISKFIDIQNQNPLYRYTEIYHLYQEHDNEYFQKKIGIFQQQITNILENVKSISHTDLGTSITEFIINCRRDFCIELSTLYHRYRHYVHEREYIYKKYPDHPYIKILKLLHQKYIETKEKITSDLIFDILFGNNSNSARYFHTYSIYNEYSNLVISAIQNRSLVFHDAYKKYSESIECNIAPKFLTNYNYYPFKVFSPYLFIMEHLTINITK